MGKEAQQFKTLAIAVATTLLIVFAMVPIAFYLSPYAGVSAHADSDVVEQAASGGEGAEVGDAIESESTEASTDAAAVGDEAQDSGAAEEGPASEGTQTPSAETDSTTPDADIPTSPENDNETDADSADVETDAAEDGAINDDAANVQDEEQEGAASSESESPASEPSADKASSESAEKKSDKSADKEDDMKATADELPSGTFSNGWAWKLVANDEENPDAGVTLQFVAPEGADPVPGLAISADFAASNLADYTTKITAIDMPEGITSIGNNAFKGATALESIAFPSTLTSIGDNAFDGCSSLATADFSKVDDAATYPENANPTPAFSIGKSAFANSGLTKVSLPDNLNAIGDSAFQNCKNLKDADLPALSYVRGTLGTAIFSGDSALENLTFREVEGRSHYNSSNRGYLPNNTLNGCTALKKLDFSGYAGYLDLQGFSGNSSSQALFPSNNIPNLEKIILPQRPGDSSKNVRLYDGFMTGKTNFTDLDVIENPESVDSIGVNTFKGSGLEEADMSDWTSLATIRHDAFAENGNLTRVVIPENVTKLGEKAFYHDSNLQSVEVRARNMGGVDNNDNSVRIYKNTFEGCNQLSNVTIGKEVDTLDANLFAAIPSSADVVFEGPNEFSVTKATASGADNPLKNMSGNYFADSNGVVYKLDDDGTASVAYVNPNVTSATIPTTITTPSGATYTVDRVEPYAVNKAKSLTALTFANPSQMHLSPNAFTGWTTMASSGGKTINGQTYINPDDWAFASVICNFPLKEGSPNAELVPSITDIVKDSDGKETVKTVIAVNDKNPSEDDTYDYKTGQKATYTIAISNEDNLIMDKVVRVYFEYSGDGYEMGSFPPGDYFLDDQGDKYPMKVVATDAPGIYYYDITGIKPGRTLAFQNDTFYPSPNSAGGYMRIWTHTMSQEQADARYGTVMNPGDYMQLDWDTMPVGRSLSKAGSKSYDSLMSSYLPALLRGTESGDVYVKDLAFVISEKNNGSGSYSEGQDFIRWVQYEDVITLPEELYWRDGAIEAIENGSWTVANKSVPTAYSSSNSTRTISVTIGGTSYDLLSVYSESLGGNTTNDTYGICGLTPSIVTEDGVKKVKITWYVNNRYLNSSTGKASSEMSVNSFYVRAGDTIIRADMDKVDALVEQVDEQGNKLMPVVQNHASETRHYTYSEDQVADASATQKVDVSAGLKVAKYWNTNGNKYFGQNDFMRVAFTNTGVVTISQWGAPVYVTDEEGKRVIKRDENGREVWDGNILTDTLNYYFYITPENIEKTLLDNTITVGGKTVDLGKGATINITAGTLCTPDQFQPSEGTDQSGKYSRSDTYANSDNGARVYQGAALKFTRTDDGRISMTLSGDTIAANNRTYTIGEGGDYATVKEAFDALGYWPTNGTSYKITYNVDDLALGAGQTFSLPIMATYKTTPMMLTKDTRYSISGSYTNNTAHYGAKVGDENRSQNVSISNDHYRNSELSFGKSGYIQGSSSAWTDSTVLNEGTVVDYLLSGVNRNGIAYDTMSMNDFMTGAQVVLVPKAQNPSLTAPDGSALHTYTAGGADYWVVNVPGTYKNVVIGALGSRTGAQTQVADITVVGVGDSSGKRTSLNTTINWHPWTNWGASSVATNLYYKTLVSGYESGLVTPGEADEGKTYRIDNRAWLGDHQGHRLWDEAGKTYKVYSFDKKIVDKAAGGKADGTDNTADGTLKSYTRVRHGNTVTYEIDINCLTTNPATLAGNRIRDRLPDTRGVFDWTRGGEGVEANVTNLRYVGSDGVEITVGTGEDAVKLNTDGSPNTGHDDYWTVEQAKDSSGNPVAGAYDIKWPSDFKITLPDHGKVKIFVDITFPERPEEGASPWDQYVAKMKGANLYNYFYLDGDSKYAYHSLEAEGKAVLYKGVYDTGLTTHRSGSNSDYAQYASNKSRLMYANGAVPSGYTDTNLRASTVTYYTVLYNGSYDRLYLSDIQDQLPRGFTFNSMASTTYTVSDMYYSYYYREGSVGYTGSPDKNKTTTEYSSSSKFVTIDNSADKRDENTVKPLNAVVTAYTSSGSDGRQHVTFRVTSGAHYDSAVGKYYLGPGEMLRFGYNVVVDEYAKTDDLATNTVAMPYYDYYHTGFELDVPNEKGEGGAVQKAAAVSGVTPNDGGCRQMTDVDVASLYGMDTSAYQSDEYKSAEGGNWLVSDVSLTRGPIVPGIQKTVGGSTVRNNNPTATTVQGSQGNFGTAYTGGLKTSDVVNWRVRVYNEAGTGNDDVTTSMANYEITDTVVKPYAFTGSMFYNMYRNNGNTASQSPLYLFTIGSRKVGSAEARASETSVRFSSGSTLSASGYRNVNIGSAEDDSDDDWFVFGTGKKEGRVKLERNADGEEVLTVQLIGQDYSIPGGMWYDFGLHTMYVDDGVVISEAKYNEAIVRPVQEYDSTKVAQGRPRTVEERDESGKLVTKNDGIQSGASVVLTQGFTTESWKRITENGNTSNTASSDEATTSITVSEKCETFKYDLYIVGPQTVMTKIVVIDDLPHIGDHSAFVEADKRYSDFKVNFLAENPDFKVFLAPSKGGKETQLTPDQYTLSVTSKTEFDRADWEGEDSEDWTEITADMTAEEVAAVLEDAMSVRVMIKDPSAWATDQSKWMMKKQCQVHISFNAEVDDPGAYPGKSAWNSFGYRYQVPLTQNGSEETSVPLSLEAQPMSVGVRYPASPSIEKKLIAQVPVMEPVTETVEEPVMVPVYQTDEEGNVITDDEGNPVPELDGEGNPVMVEMTEVVYQTDEEGNVVTDEDGNPVPELDEDGNPVTRVVTQKVERVVMETVKVPVIDPETGEQKVDAEGNPVFEEVEQPKMQQKVDAEGNPVTETAAHEAAEDLDFEFIIYEGEAIPELDSALGMTRAEIAKALADNDRQYVYSKLTVKAGETAALEGLWNRDNASYYDAEADEFVVLDPDTPWHWRSGKRYTLLELPFGDYDYEHRTNRAGNVETETNNLSFENSNAAILRLVAVNEWTPEYVDIPVAKVWDDANDQDGVRPGSVTVRLLADGEEVDSATITAEDGWKHTFEHLLVETETGHRIVYTVTEDAVVGTHAKAADSETEPSNVADTAADNPTAAVDDATAAGDGDGSTAKDADSADAAPETSTDTVAYTTSIVMNDEGGYDWTIVNTHVPEMIDIPGKKTWDDANDQDGKRPESITIRLLADGEEVDSVEVTAEDGWEWTFEGLPKYKAGEEISYKVTEDAVADYSTTYDGFDVTNSYTPGKTSVTVTKVWDDHDDYAELRPESVTIHLLADGKDTGEKLVLTEADGWQGSFAGLDEYKDGKKIAYTVTEDPVAEYTTAIAGSAEEGYVVVNLHYFPVWPPEPQSDDEPEDNVPPEPAPEPAPEPPTPKPDKVIPPDSKIVRTSDMLPVAAVSLVAGGAALIAAIAAVAMRRRRKDDEPAGKHSKQ